MIFVETNESRGVLLFNAIELHNIYCGQSAPYLVDSRPVIRLDNDGKPGRGRFFCAEARAMSKMSSGESARRNQMFTQGFLWCKECQQFKPVKRFYKTRSSKVQPTNYGYRFYCIECDNHKKRNKPQKKQYHKVKNYALKRQFVDLAGGSCQRCGFGEFITALDFHHVYPSQKKYNPTWVIYTNNFKRAWAELDKCCLLCATCHKAYNGNEWRAEFVKRDGLGWTVGQPLPLDDSRYESKPEKVQQSAFPLHLLKNDPVQLSF